MSYELTIPTLYQLWKITCHYAFPGCRPIVSIHEAALTMHTGLFNIRERYEHKFTSILSNYKQAVIARKYLISTIYTLLHHAEYSSSTREIFIQDLKNQKEIFLRNAYPEKLVDEIFAKY